jgi:alkanesulfonate monooxygenase SsuD/methylene tetrahydromethanopterin reductase-like flavin-dependent oxidoreductase (luciferase family)
VTAAVKVGLVVPSFRLDAGTGIDTAVRAEAAGLDGAFVYDHLFPMGQPHRPAVSCFPMLGAIAAVTERIEIGPLVARVGVVPNAVLVNMFDALERMAPGRVIAGVGTGDSKSQAENQVFGLPFGTVDERVAATADVCRGARALGLPVWVGGQSPRVRRLAADEADAINVWAMTPDQVATVTEVRVTWAGPPPEGDLGGHIAALAEAGATWVIYGAPPSADWPAFVDRLAAASARL